MKFKLKSLLSAAQIFSAVNAEREQGGKRFELLLPAGSELIINDYELSKLNTIKMFESLLDKGKLILERIEDVTLHDNSDTENPSEKNEEVFHEKAEIEEDLYKVISEKIEEVEEVEEIESQESKSAKKKKGK